MQKNLIIILGLTTALLAGCADFSFPFLYRINVEQGNIVNQEMIDQLRPGMTRRQVRFIMGTPKVADPFNQDRWDYLYTVQFARGDRVTRHASLFFENELLARIEGDWIPNDVEQP